MSGPSQPIRRVTAGFLNPSGEQTDVSAANPLPVTTPAAAPGTQNARVFGWDGANWEEITKTDESGKSALDAHLTNATIEKTIGAAIGTLVLLQGVSDGTNARALRAYTDGRAQLSNYTGSPTDEQIAVAAATAVQIPTAIPALPYRITFSVDPASTGVWAFRRTTGTTLGHRFYPGQIIILEMGSGQGLFVYHDQGTSQNLNVCKEPIE